MLFKNLLVLVGRADAATPYALGLAAACGATLTAAAPVIEPDSVALCAPRNLERCPGPRWERGRSRG